MKNTRIKAFTLAEVLITLGVIGAVAVAISPILIKNYQEKVTVKKLKKVYSSFTNATVLAIEENGELSTWNLSSDKFVTVFEKYLKVASTCKSNCQTYRPVNLQGSSDYTDLYSSRMILADGTYIGHIYINSSTCSINWGSQQLRNSCGSFKIDLNGAQKPNMYGRDIFGFYITASGIFPYGIPQATAFTGSFSGECANKGTRMGGLACTGWVIYNGNMDYLRCPEKLGWNKVLKCKQ